MGLEELDYYSFQAFRNPDETQKKIHPHARYASTVRAKSRHDHAPFQLVRRRDGTCA